jgi:hypothetical protein
VTLAEVIRAVKADVDVGSWQQGHIPRSAFPLSLARAKNYKFGPEYVRFSCLGANFRVLLLLNEGKSIYRATLGLDEGSDTKFSATTNITAASLVGIVTSRSATARSCRGESIGRS